MKPVRMVERRLEMAEATVPRSAGAQRGAGARAVIVCEPAANAGRGADLIFHNCGELTTEMVRQFAHELRPVMLSPGSSRKRWEDARVVPPDVVLFGHLPTQTFYFTRTARCRWMKRGDGRPNCSSGWRSATSWMFRTPHAR
jgi:hypothetical protein